MEHERAFPDAESGLTGRAIRIGRTMMDHGLSWKPVEPEGAGRGKRWPGVTDEQWRELYAAASSLSGEERKALCDQYHISYQSLRQKSGHAAPPSAGGGPARQSPPRAARQPRSKEEILDGMREHARELSAELALVELKIEKLEAIDDELFDEIRNLMS